MSRAKVVIITTILAIIFGVVGFIGGFVGYIFIYPQKSDVFISGELSIHFMELGNQYTGDSIFIQCGETDILIDGGSRTNSSKTIANYVNNYVSDGKLEYVIVTHAHEDHIAGFAGDKTNKSLFDYYDVGTIIDFPKTEKDTDVYHNYVASREREVEVGANHYTALECYNNENGGKRVYELSNSVELEILYNYYYENKATTENDYSVCVMINQGDNHYLLTGDLEEKGEEKLVEFYKDLGTPLPHCVLYKAGHHGSYTASSALLMEAITPEYVVVTCVAGSDEYSDMKEKQFLHKIL